MMMRAGIEPGIRPSSDGCVECIDDGGWWFHLRRCAKCGHIGCCDSSPAGHARAHAESTGHQIIRTFEPGEDWFWDYLEETYLEGPKLAGPAHHPLDRPVPDGVVPSDWKALLRR
jgi:hypothetical protein